MTEAVFWDTVAFVALGNRDDALHAVAIATSQRLARAQSKAVTTDAVLTEVANTFSKAPWRKMASHIINTWQQSAILGIAEVIHVDQSLWQRGWELFQERADKDWSLTDCISFVAMQDRGLTEAFTSDRHFVQAGFRILIQK